MNYGLQGNYFLKPAWNLEAIRGSTFQGTEGKKPDTLNLQYLVHIIFHGIDSWAMALICEISARTFLVQRFVYILP